MIAPIYNRTASDVTRAANLLRKIRTEGFYSLTPDDQAAWAAGMKALENYTDWNRQNANIHTAATDILPSLGYKASGYIANPSADMEAVPTLDGVNRLESNLNAIGNSGLTMPIGWIPSVTWTQGRGPGFSDWNRWERNMALLEEMATRIAAAWYYSGDLYSGEV